MDFEIFGCSVRCSLTYADAVAVYKDGRVCISILHDPGDDPHGYETAAERWSPVQSVRFSSFLCSRSVAIELSQLLSCLLVDGR